MSLSSPVSGAHHWFSEARMRPFLLEAGNDSEAALDLYRWNGELAAACFEVMGHLEVLLRNAMDGRLQEHFKEASIGIPWFLVPIIAGKEQSTLTDRVESVRLRLREKRKESRDQIIAGMNFGFWTSLLGTAYEEVWRKSLRLAFPNGSGKRSDLAAACNGLRNFRNRLAHPDSLLAVDVPFQLRQMLLVAGWIDDDAKQWLNDVERVTETYARRPSTNVDTVVIPGRDAWPFYEAHHAYVCQAGRTFRPVERIAFYADKSIKPDVPRITERIDNVDWSISEQARLLKSPSSKDQRIGRIIAASRDAGWTDGRYQLFLLTQEGHPDHRSLAGGLPHEAKGRGSAFVQRQRYVSLHALETATTTTSLQTSGE